MKLYVRPSSGGEDIKNEMFDRYYMIMGARDFAFEMANFGYLVGMSC